MTCEVVQGREAPACFAPVEVRGTIFNLDDRAAIGGARITAQDINGAPLGTVAISEDDGSYALRIPTERTDEKGTRVGRTVTLRASADDFQTFPAGARVAIPVDTSAAAQAEEGKPWIVAGGQTEIGLSKIAEAEQAYPSISGHVEIESGQLGVLVVAEAEGQMGRSAVADANGAFVIYNVPPGTWTIKAFSRGVNYTPAAAAVEAGKDLAELRVKRSTTPAATVKGTVNIVATEGATSVVMVVKSTFIESLARGEVPPGLRAPEGGTAANVSGAFEITGVPDGEYVVLAAFENDGLVRDPNTNTAGTEIQYVTVSNGTANRETTFKVTNAITVISPGAGDGLEDAAATPTFKWQPYPSARSYRVQVFDTFGIEQWNSGSLFDLASSGEVSLTYGGTNALVPGQIYQWRATAYATAGQPISQTEDLKGLFRVQ